MEQLYDLLSSIHKYIRKYELVYDLNLEENKRRFLENDPNTFPIYNMSYNSTKPDFMSIWNLDKEILKDIQKEVGFALEIRNSNIEHHEADKGVFLKTLKKPFVLPGTLLGFYPGV